MIFFVTKIYNMRYIEINIINGNGFAVSLVYGIK